MSAREMVVSERETYANPHCFQCGGTGTVYAPGDARTRGLSYRLECTCVGENKANPIQLDKGPNA